MSWRRVILREPEIVSANLESDSLTDICDVLATMRSIDTDDEELVKTFADHGCTCVFGPHKSPCCKQFSEDHYLAVRGPLSEITKDELDLMVMGQIMAHCSPSPSAPSPSTSPAEKDRGARTHAHTHEVLSCRPLCVSANVSISAHHRNQAL